MTKIYFSFDEIFSKSLTLEISKHLATIVPIAELNFSWIENCYVIECPNALAVKIISGLFSESFKYQNELTLTKLSTSIN